MIKASRFSKPFNKNYRQTKLPGDEHNRLLYLLGGPSRAETGVQEWPNNNNNNNKKDLAIWLLQCLEPGAGVIKNNLIVEILLKEKIRLTTWDVKNRVSNVIDYLSTGAGFLPSTFSKQVLPQRIGICNNL